jgi:hypothetical protein
LYNYTSIRRNNMRYLFLLLALTSCCYRMPGDEDFCTNPATNNPAITCEKSSGLMPGAKY